MDNKNRKYNSVKRKKIINKIKKIKNKETLIKIFKLVKNEIGDKLSSNKNGVFFNINLLTDNTVEKINLILKEYYQNSETSSISTIQYTPYSKDDLNSNTSGPRLSNQEKNLIKKLRKNT